MMWETAVAALDGSPKAEESRSLHVALHREAGVDYLNETAALIRELTPVQRVHVDPHQFRLEIIYDHPAPGILLQIHQALLTTGKQMMPAWRY